MGKMKHTIRAVLESIFARGAELSNESLHDCPYMRDTIFEKAETTLRKIIAKEKNNGNK